MVKIKMNFPSSVFCNNAGKNVLDKRIREALQKLNKNWNFCINTVEGRSRARRAGVCAGRGEGVGRKDEGRVLQRSQVEIYAGPGQIDFASESAIGLGPRFAIKPERECMQ